MTLALVGLVLVSLLVGAGFGWWLNGTISVAQLQRQMRNLTPEERVVFLRVFRKTQREP
jgi:hypothetical protein